ncbi:3-phosphoshikimate 1-carboxyvinyltransferase [Bacillus kwashiorkori]|uniref:3-phosphoshikimate 1-carboxyvinyltransferase n=1 Tax=Bacillus kwashiorkori TaxID=1522318 RepID=UPI000780CBDE|nr:3-phosphoshikimate 1-carboxyvinyltransferase [Bacillus kwashiorkori]
MTIMKLHFTGHPVKTIIEVPGDKSISHRAIMFAAIAHGKTTITNLLVGEDVLQTIRCFRQLGVDIQQSDEKVTVIGNGFHGLKEPRDVLYTGNSGTTTRLLFGLLASLPYTFTFTGDASLNNRPMKRITIPLTMMGATFIGRNNDQYLPMTIRGANLQAINYHMPVASAQVKSALIFAALQANGITTIYEKAPSRNHTEIMLQYFGGQLRRQGNEIIVEGQQSLLGKDIHVPGDFSSAAFFIVMAAISDGREVTIKNVGLNPTRTGLVEVLQQMNGKITITEPSIKNGERVGTIIVKASELQGTVIEGEIIPRLIDEIPIIALLATQCSGTTIIKDASELKVKESNRIDTVVTELRKLGADIEATDDGLIIRGKRPLTGGIVNSHGDHRIGMMLAIAATICKEEVILENPECISISYPSFFQDLNKCFLK